MRKTNFSPSANENKKKPRKAYNLALKYADESVEESFISQRRNYQLSISIYSHLLFLIASLVFWAIGKNPREALIVNLLKIPAFLIFLWLRIKYPQRIELIAIISMAPCFYSLFDNIGEQAVTGENRMSSYTSGVLIEFFCIIWILLKVCWKKTVLILFITNFLLGLKYYFTNFDLGEKENRIKFLNICILNFVIHSALSYIVEKYERIKFLELFQKENSLSFLEKFIKESLPLGVIVIGTNEVIFNNNESKMLLGIEGRELNFEDLDILEFEENSFKADAHSELRSEKDSHLGKNTFLRSLNNMARSGKRRKSSFLAFKKSCPQKEKNCGKFHVKINKIIWKKEFATIITLNEDISAIKLGYIQDFELFKDRVLASVSHQFRTPLNAVMGILESLLETSDDQDLKER